MNHWLFYTVMALCFYGLWAFFPKLAGGSMNPKSAMLFISAGSAGAALLLAVFMDGPLEWPRPGVVFSLLTGATGIIGTLFLLHALKTGKTAIVVTATALYPVITLALAAIFLKEPLSLKQGAGIVAALIAMALMAG